MLLTSYFAKSSKHPGAVSIARFPPKWYTGRRYLPLAPKPEMLKIGDWEEYRRRYREEILAPLDPDVVLRDLGVGGAEHDIVPPLLRKGSRALPPRACSRMVP